MLLDSKQLSFYQWEGDVQALLDNVRRKINQLAEGWTAPQKEHCLAETLASFKVSRA
jgi:heme oxygenase